MEPESVTTRTAPLDLAPYCERLQTADTLLNALMAAIKDQDAHTAFIAQCANDRYKQPLSGSLSAKDAVGIYDAFCEFMESNARDRGLALVAAHNAAINKMRYMRALAHVHSASAAASMGTAEIFVFHAGVKPKSLNSRFTRTADLLGEECKFYVELIHETFDDFARNDRDAAFLDEAFEKSKAELGARIGPIASDDALEALGQNVFSTYVDTNIALSDVYVSAIENMLGFLGFAQQNSYVFTRLIGKPEQLFFEAMMLVEDWNYKASAHSQNAAESLKTMGATAGQLPAYRP